MANEAAKTEATKGEAAGGASAASGASPPRAGGKLLTVMLGFNGLLTAGVLALLLLRPAGGLLRTTAAESHPEQAAAGAPPEPASAEKPKEPARDAAQAQPQATGPTVKLPDFVVHLRDTEFDRYARLTVEVEVADEKAKESLATRLPHIRDTFISYLSDRTTADLRGSEAIARAKLDLADRLKKAAPGVPVRALFVTELVVQ